MPSKAVASMHLQTPTDVQLSLTQIVWADDCTSCRCCKGQPWPLGKPPSNSMRWALRSHKYYTQGLPRCAPQLLCSEMPPHLVQALHKVAVAVQEAGQGQHAKSGAAVHAVEDAVVARVRPQRAHAPPHHCVEGRLLRHVAAALQRGVPAAKEVLRARAAPEVQDACSRTRSLSLAGQRPVALLRVNIGP